MKMVTWSCYDPSMKPGSSKVLSASFKALFPHGFRSKEMITTWTTHILSYTQSLVWVHLDTCSTSTTYSIFATCRAFTIFYHSRGTFSVLNLGDSRASCRNRLSGSNMCCCTVSCCMCCLWRDLNCIIFSWDPKIPATFPESFSESQNLWIGMPWP